MSRLYWIGCESFKMAMSFSRELLSHPGCWMILSQNSVSLGSKDPPFSWLLPGLYINRISEVSSYKLPSYGDVNSLGSV